MLCPLLVSTFSYLSLQSKIFLVKQFSLLAISALSAAVKSPGCQNSSSLVAPGILVSNYLFHEVKPGVLPPNDISLKKLFRKDFFSQIFSYAEVQNSF